MNRIVRLFGFVTVAALLVVGCNNEDSNNNNNGGTGNGTPNVPAEIAIARSFPPLLANGVDKVEIRATVVDGQGRGLSGVGVLFTTDRGTLDPFGTTGEDGVAKTTLTSVASNVDVAATVQATAVSDSGSVSKVLGPLAADLPIRTLKPLPEGAVVLVTRRELPTHQLELAARLKREGRLVPSPLQPGDVAADVVDQAAVPMTGITLALASDPGTIPADGISQSRIIARLVETTSRVPITGETVSFGATAGSITGAVESDETGTASATLTGLSSGATSTITAFYGHTLTAQTTVSFSPLTLTLGSALASVRADGVSSTTVTARLVNDQHNPVAGVPINFATDRGSVTSPVVTDANGEANSTLRAGTTTGTAAVSATFGALSAQTTVQFVSPPVAQSIVLAADPAALPANGSARTKVTATILDAQGARMPDNTPVTFTIVSGGGQLISPNALTAAGDASCDYVASTTPGGVVLRATAGTATRTVQVTLTPLEAGSVSLVAGAPTVLADGVSSTTLTATVTDDFGNPVAPGTLVSFSATLGAIEAVTPTDGNGVATARLRSERFLTGIARVTASAGNGSRSVDVKFVSEAAHHIVIVELDRPRIGIIGTGSPQTATLTLEVRDRNGIPVDLDHAATVNFTIVPTGGATDATLSTASAQTNEKGQVIAIVRAGTIAGVVEVKANVGSIVSAPIRVAVHGDLPDASHFSIAFEHVNIAGLVFDGLRNGVTAHVGDAKGNPVPDSTSVWYTANFGLIQGSAFTDEHAEATVWEVTAAPRPQIPGGNGLVLITAQTVAKDGSYITTSGNVMWSGPTILEITNPTPAQGFVVPDGGSIAIHFRVRDANNNPLVGGTQISAKTTSGNIGGDIDTVLPDTQDPAYTNFTVILSDADPGDPAPPAATTVTIKITSQNGNAVASITGTVN